VPMTDSILKKILVKGPFVSFKYVVRTSRSTWAEWCWFRK
jgi:hypothetical protein